MTVFLFDNNVISFIIEVYNLIGDINASVGNIIFNDGIRFGFRLCKDMIKISYYGYAIKEDIYVDMMSKLII